MISMKTVMKKRTAVVAAVLMVLNIFASGLIAHAATPVAIAAWDYTAASSSAIVPATSGMLKDGAVLTNFKNAVPTYGAGSLSINGWDNGTGTKYWQLSLSTKGCESLALSAKTRSSGTGPRDFKMIYSTDNGANWVDVPNSTYAITGTGLSNYMPTISLPSDAANVDNLLIRFIMTSNISSRAGTSTYPATETVQSGGTSNINNIVVSGKIIGAVTASPDSGAVPTSTKVSLTCETEGTSIMYSVNGSEYALYDPNEQVTLSTLPATLNAYSIKDGKQFAPVFTYNYTQAKAASVSASPNGGAVYINKLVALSCSTPGAAIKYSMDGGTTWDDYTSPITLSVLPITIKAYAAAEGYLDGPTATFNFTEKVSESYNIYFGQLHSHTNYSDGIGTPDDAYSHAKNVAKVDFLAVTDHSNSLDNAANATMANAGNSPEWTNGHAIADSYTDSTFVGIYGYEMTWNNGTGHINTFNTPGFETRDNQIYKNVDGLQQYYNVLKQFPDSISQFNHPGTTFGDFNNFANYDPEIDKQITLIEVGNGEGKVGSSMYFPSYDYYTRALDKGWHLSPTNNQDNHLGNWGDSNTARTVVLADSLTRDSIYDAMRNMRTYATEDNDLRIKYTLNGEVMGTVMDQKPGAVDIKVDLEDPDNEALGKVSVISDGGKVVASKTLATSKDTVEFNLPPDYAYYYIRVDEADKDIAVTAPVWISEVDKAGISSIKGSTTLPIKGEKFTVATELYNNEEQTMNIESLVYSIEGKVINTAPSLNAVGSCSTGSYSFDYTPDTAGKFNIDAKLTANINGVEKVFNDTLSINVTDPAIVTRVLVDASHYNDYVSGYYSGNMTNLVTLANGEMIDVKLQKDPITVDALKNIQLLILSPPAKKAGTVNGTAYPISPYTADEIAAIKSYADSGGNIIVTALADYQDWANSTNHIQNPPEYHSAYQQNQVLEAIGAETRINDDEVVDYDNNPNVNPAGVAGGTPYRVPMNVYNMDSPYLNGVVPQQNYSFYSGCSITLGPDATWLIKGTPTTYGFDSDNDGLGGTYVAAANKTIPADTGIGKGNVVALAAETLPGGGKLFVGGTIFYSNFEIKTQLDNATQLQNSNYNITMNILDSIKKTIPVTPINEVRSANKGDVFCVEGTVTAGTLPKDNAFFDTIYIQDSTGGINLFPVSGMDIKIGQKVKAAGSVDEYLGDKELRVIDYSVTDTSINPLEPVILPTKDAMDSKNGGLLVKTTGKVTKMDSQNIYVDDGSGEARAFLDGYIGDGTGDPSKIGKWDPGIQAGQMVTIVGLASVDPVGSRLRVRNTAEIVRDTTKPTITVSGISNGQIFKLNENVLVTWGCSDDYSGIASSSGTVASGGAIDTSTVGPHTMTFTAADHAGNKTETTITYNVEYVYSGVLKPLSNDGLNTLKHGSPVVAKFQLKDINGIYQTGAEAKLYVDDSPEGFDFRYDNKNNQYVCNLNTKGLASGIHTIRIDLKDGSNNIITIYLR